MVSTKRRKIKRFVRLAELIQGQIEKRSLRFVDAWKNKKHYEPSAFGIAYMLAGGGNEEQYGFLR